MKTLVIHPIDPTTDLLKPIYEGKDWTVINTIVSNKEMIEAIKAHDRIIMLGHGYEGGLFDLKRGVIISSKHVYLLRNKICYGIWCNANVFFEKYKLNGFYSGMIISEVEEAYVYGIPVSYDEINASNVLFGNTVAKYIDDSDLVSKIQSEYVSDSCKVIQFNRNNLFKTF